MFLVPVIPRRVHLGRLLAVASGPLAFLASSGFIVWLMRSV